MSGIYQQLFRIQKVTEEIAGLIDRSDDENLEEIFSRIKDRDEMVEMLKRDALLEPAVAGAHLTQKSHLPSSEIREMFTNIMKLDKQNMEVINSKLSKISHSLAELAKEKRTMKDLRSISRMGHKQIIDFSY